MGAILYNTFVTDAEKVRLTQSISSAAIIRLSCYAALLVLFAHASDAIGAGTLSIQGNLYRVADAKAGDSPASAETKFGGACSFDQTKPSSDNKELIASGWAILSKDGSLADDVYLEVEYSGGKERITVQRDARPDVAAFFNSDALLRSGFIAVLKRETGAKVKVLQVAHGSLYQCEVQHVMK